MGTKALDALLSGIGEVQNLQRANPTPAGALPSRPQVVRAINRASVVLLCSHLERYLRAVNEEAVAIINQATIANTVLPERFRLQHSKDAVDTMLNMRWENRSGRLASFIIHDGWLWGTVSKGDLHADRLINWMKTPTPDQIVRLFALWGIPNVFDEITRKRHTRTRFWLRLTELVEKRNNIAHGDADTIATYQDIASYQATVRDFCSRTDRLMGRTLMRLLGIVSPW